jgi:predicted aspartyl protease
LSPPAARREGRRRHAAYTFGYATAEWGNVRDKLPMIPVVLSWRGKGLRTKMLLDTGATTTFLIPDLVEYLELELSGEPKEAHGAGRMFLTRDAEVDIQLEVARQFGAEPETHRIAVKVPAEADAIPFPVIGRKPFFHFYEISIREREEQVVLRRVYHD